MKITKISAALGVATALGVAALPLASYAANTATTSISVLIDETLSITATATETATVTNNAAVNETMKPVVTVITNHSSGYVVSAKTTHTGGPALKTTGGASIPAASPATGTSAWAIKGGALSAYTPLATSDTTVLSSGNPTAATGVATTFTIGVTAASNQAAGTYTGTITWSVATQ